MSNARLSSTYRGARRNAARAKAAEFEISFREVWPHFLMKSQPAKGARRKRRAAK